MNRVVLLLLSLICISTLIGCGSGSDDKALHEIMNGTWVSDIMTVTIDFDKGTYKGVALGQPFDRKLTLVEEEANLVTFKADENTIICQVHEDGDTITLTKQLEDGGSGIPVTLKRD